MRLKRRAHALTSHSVTNIDKVAAGASIALETETTGFESTYQVFDFRLSLESSRRRFEVQAPRSATKRLRNENALAEGFLKFDTTRTRHRSCAMLASVGHMRAAADSIKILELTSAPSRSVGPPGVVDDVAEPTARRALRGNRSE
ncbi:hypothetical protein EVAR_103457_1 [Eumeta japonica]|uniref:Uncharacterized protein n=1 Tax=Eumeta variegata TaxID=151549 RepID=A0A4C1YZW3_EUMVA|nr:hypothetical protein EVAR_103457_1 [Eumeta japonica]